MPGSPFSNGKSRGRLRIRYHRKDGPPMFSLSKLINGRRAVPAAPDNIPPALPLALPAAPDVAYLGLVMIAHSAVSDPALFAAWVDANPEISTSLMPANLPVAYVGRYLDNLCHQLMQVFSGVPMPTYGDQLDML